MRIRRIHVQSVLHFADYELDFGTASTGLHLLHGPNEAGKSTLLQLLIDMLYGGPMAERMKDAYDSRSRLEVVLEQPGQPAVTVRRKKNRARLVLEANASVTEDDLLGTYLGGYDRDRYTLLFGFNHERLRAGGDSLLQSGGEAGVSLFEAGGGVQYLQQVLAKLSEQSANLLDRGFMARSAKLLNRAWREFQEAERAVRDTSLRGDAWHRQRDAIAQLQRTLDDLVRRLEEKRNEQIRLTRLNRIRGLLTELQRIRQQMEEMGQVVVLSDAVDQRVREVLQAERELTRRLAEQAAEYERLRGQRAQIAQDPAVLACAEDINGLSEGLRQYETRCQEELPQAQQQLHQRRQDAMHLLKRLAPATSLDDVHTLCIPFADQARIERLAEALRQARSDVEREQQRCEAMRAEQDTVSAALAQMPVPPDVSGLRRLIQEVREQGNLDEAIDRLNQEITLKQRDVERLYHGQTVWRGALTEAPSLPIPVSETLERYARTFAEVEDGLRDCDRKLEQARESQARAEEELEALERTGIIPVEEDLQRIRMRRDAGWRLVKQAWLSGGVDEGDCAAFVEQEGGAPLHEVFERLLREADETADWMRKEADRSASRALWMLKREQAQRELERLMERREALANQWTACWDQWREEWRAAAIEPKSPAEMKDFVNHVLRPIAEGIRGVEALAAERAKLTSRRDAYRDALAEALAVQHAADREPVAGVPRGASSLPAAGGKGAGLSKWLRQAELHVEAVAEREAERRELAAQQKRLAEGLAVQARSAKQARDQLAALEAQWDVLHLEFPGLPQEAEVATGYVRQLTQLFDWVRDIERLQSDIDRLRADCRAFEQRAEVLARQLDERIADFPSLAAWVRHVRERLRNAQAAFNQAEHVRQELTRAQKLMQDTETKLRAVQREIDQYLEDYHCQRREDLYLVAERSSAYKEAAASRDHQERFLRETGDGLSVSELEAEFAAFAAAESPHRLPARIETLTTEIQELQAQLDEHKDTLREMQITFRALDGSQTTAADHAQQAEAHLAEVDRLWNEYLRVELARRLLHRAIEVFREQNQSSVLQRASEFFHRLTVGRYRALSVEHDGTEWYLEAEHADGTHRRVHHMSDGTRDQLFLSLRLAFVAQQVQSGGFALPLIMDDILVHFDDQRTRAALQVLHELAAETQILYFTHHQSVVDAVQGLAESGRVQIHPVNAAP
ncbi:AAA family ATPase [Alicyclobacillus cycloheptanicus]|uniref:Uncharacterized protein YhaN n=1 Tax=Alicyclobacillus cycloheptanicus TaxID=1457 RepID=A0ABT9XFF4_9BACL|nr:AAA family ATPase [Alicyclobacillus cycloheptanicus]MDQ0189022.1 uncharacterized protein YhaN [Alicyclobacillus cycloheptanicus]WDM01640.1 AAA family ATPase [Alicyclobacillus cycloheptanicus]